MPPLYTDVSSSIRALLDDLVVSGGATFTDAYCLKYAQMASDTLSAYLMANSVESAFFRLDNIAVPALTTTLDYAVVDGGTAGPNIANVLPAQLVVPDQLWEAKVGGLNSDYFPMSGPNPIPRIPQSDTLGYWDWYGGKLSLLGSTVDRLVRMAYWAYAATINPASHIPIVCASNALAALAASDIARSRGAYQLADSLATYNNELGTIGGKAGFECLQIIEFQIKEQQSEPVRRQPMFGRDRYSTQNFFIRGRS